MSLRMPVGKCYQDTRDKRNFYRQEEFRMIHVMALGPKDFWIQSHEMDHQFGAICRKELVEIEPAEFQKVLDEARQQINAL